jgi:hypothetical protein
MAKDKNRKKGIVDPRKAERASKRAASTADKAKADADLQSKVEKANTIAAAIQENRPEDTTPAAPSYTPPTEVTQLDADVKLGYADRPIPRGERSVPTLDPETIAEDAVGAAAIQEDDRRKALVESGENLQPRTPLDVVKGIQDRRAAAEQERVAGMARVDLPSNVGEGFDEVTDAEAARRASGRTARRRTGIVDFRDIAGGGREGAGLTSEQEARAARRTAARAESAASAGMDVERRSAAEAVFGGPVEDWSAGQRPYTDKPEVMDLARRLKTTELMDQGKEITPEAVETGLQGGPHQRMARIIHHTGMTAEEVQTHIGGRASIATDKLNELHETVMRNVRSRRKNDVLPRMGLARGEDGSIAATEAAQNETWQHPTEKDANGLPKIYKVSDMHPDMVKQLNHPWGGVQSENEFEGTSVLRETPAISGAAKNNPALRYANTVTKGAGDYMPASIRFGHSKNAAGSWSFTPPPEGFTDSNLSDPEGFTSNVTHITNAIREGRTRPGTRPAHAERTKSLIDQLAAEGKRIGGKRQVAVPMPGFTQNGGAPATTTYKRDIVDIPKAGDDNIVTYDDLPHVKDANGNLVPLAPRSGVPGTGRSVHVVQGTMGLGRQFKSPAESSAEVLGGAFGGADQPTPVRQEENRADAAAAFGGEVATDATEAIDKGPRSARSRSLVQGDSRVGKQFMGVAALPSRGAKQGIIPGFENYGNVERQRAIPEVFSTRTLEGPLPAGVDTRSAAGLTEKMTPENTPEKTIGEAIEFRDVETETGVTERLRVPGPGRAVTVKPNVLRGSEAATLNTGLPDSRTLRLRAEAASGRPTIGAVEQPAPAKKPDYTQDELDFNPRVPGVVKTRQFMLGDIRTLTDAEQNVENVGANTIRGMNPPLANFDVGSPAATAARSTVEAPPSSGVVELSKRGGGRRGLQAGEKIKGTNVVVNSTKGGVKGKKSRPLKRPPNSAALAE